MYLTFRVVDNITALQVSQSSHPCSRKVTQRSYVVLELTANLATHTPKLTIHPCMHAHTRHVYMHKYTCIRLVPHTSKAHVHTYLEGPPQVSRVPAERAGPRHDPAGGGHHGSLEGILKLLQLKSS